MLRYTSYTFDAQTQYLKVTPEPGGPGIYTGSSIGDDCGACAGYARPGQCYLIGVYLSPTVKEMLATYWVQEYVLAKAKVTLGTIRRFSKGVPLYGGATLDGDELITEGNKRIEELMKELRQDNYYSSGPLFYCG